MISKFLDHGLNLYAVYLFGGLLFTGTEFMSSYFHVILTTFLIGFMTYTVWSTGAVVAILSKHHAINGDRPLSDDEKLAFSTVISRWDGTTVISHIILAVVPASMWGVLFLPVALFHLFIYYRLYVNIKKMKEISA